MRKFIRLLSIEPLNRILFILNKQYRFIINNSIIYLHY